MKHSQPDKQIITKHKQTQTHTRAKDKTQSLETSKLANVQTNKDSSQEAGEQRDRQANRQTEN